MVCECLNLKKLYFSSVLRNQEKTVQKVLFVTFDE